MSGRSLTSPPITLKLDISTVMGHPPERVIAERAITTSEA